MNGGKNDWLRRAQEVLPGASLGSFFAPDGQELVVAGAEGARVTDVSGKVYLDYILSSGPMILGHAPKAVLQAVQEQAERGTTYYALNTASIELAEELVSSTPGADMAKFCSSGSEATFFALRLARAFTGRNKVLKFEGAYHGSHDYALMSMAPPAPADFPRPVPDCAGIPQVLQEQVLIAPFNDLERTLEIIEQHKHDLAAVLIEPESRLIPPLPGFLEALREATTRHGILLVFDEVVMGFRLIYGSVQKIYGVEADLVAYGKIIGGGYPLAAVTGRREIMALSNPREKAPNYAYISGTLSGNPIGATAGLATLGALREPDGYRALHRSGDALRAGLRDITARLSIPAQVLGSGPMANLYFLQDEVRSYRDVLHENRELKLKLRQELLGRGILTNLWQKMYISLAHSDEDIAMTLQAVEDSLRALVRPAKKAMA